MEVKNSKLYSIDNLSKIIKESIEKIPNTSIDSFTDMGGFLVGNSPFPLESFPIYNGRYYSFITTVFFVKKEESEKSIAYNEKLFNSICDSVINPSRINSISKEIGTIDVTFKEFINNVIKETEKDVIDISTLGGQFYNYMRDFTANKGALYASIPSIPNIRFITEGNPHIKFFKELVDVFFDSMLEIVYEIHIYSNDRYGASKYIGTITNDSHNQLIPKYSFKYRPNLHNFGDDRKTAIATLNNYLNMYDGFERINSNRPEDVIDFINQHFTNSISETDDLYKAVTELNSILYTAEKSQNVKTWSVKGLSDLSEVFAGNSSLISKSMFNQARIVERSFLNITDFDNYFEKEDLTII